MVDTPTMKQYLAVISIHGTKSREMLLGRGISSKQIRRLAERAARRGFIDYGVAVDRG